MYFCIIGLCGAIHSGVARYIRNELADDSRAQNTKVICIGDKSRAILQRLYSKNIIFVANEIGRLPPTFIDASRIASEILNCGYDFTDGELVFNTFKSVVSYNLSQLPIFSQSVVEVRYSNYIVFAIAIRKYLTSFKQFAL